MQQRSPWPHFAFHWCGGAEKHHFGIQHATHATADTSAPDAHACMQATPQHNTHDTYAACLTSKYAATGTRTLNTRRDGCPACGTHPMQALTAWQGWSCCQQGRRAALDARRQGVGLVVQQPAGSATVPALAGVGAHTGQGSCHSSLVVDPPGCRAGTRPRHGRHGCGGRPVAVVKLPGRGWWAVTRGLLLTGGVSFSHGAVLCRLMGEGRAPRAPAAQSAARPAWTGHG
jgi:hypothetical protein